MDVRTAATFVLLVSVHICRLSAQTESTRDSSQSEKPCAECERLADRSMEYFTSYKFFDEFKRDNVTKPWMKAGIRSCDEFRWAYQCFQHCREKLESGVGYSYPPRYYHLRAIISKYCETGWTADEQSCRMADTRVCDKLHNRRLCGKDLEDYKKCLGDVLKESGQDCSGVCTPARRFHKTLIFQWDMECKLKKSKQGWCGDYINLFCFGDMKDTDLSWGHFDELNENARTQNLMNFCPKLEAPLDCLQKTVDTWLLYFGFNITKPCSSVRPQIQEIKQLWRGIIHPLCGGRPNNTVYIQDLCGSKPTTLRMPSTTTTQAPSTTPFWTRRRRIMRRQMMKHNRGVSLE